MVSALRKKQIISCSSVEEEGLAVIEQLAGLCLFVLAPSLPLPPGLII